MLDRETADRLWSSRFREEISSVANKYYWLDPLGDPYDVRQDLIEQVWLKAVSNFDPKRARYSDVEPMFAAFFTMILKQTLSNMIESYNSEKRKNERRTESLDRPVEDEDYPSSMVETIPSDFDLFEHVQQGQDFDNMASRLDPKLESIVRFIASHDFMGEKLENQSRIRGNLWREIEDQWGMTQDQVLEALADEPDFVDYIQRNVPRKKRRSVVPVGVAEEEDLGEDRVLQ